MLIKENFLSTQLIDQYIQFLKHTDSWERNGDEIWDNRSLNLHSMPAGIRESILNYRIQVKNTIQEKFAVTQPLYSDIFQFVRWNIGNELWPAHADAEHLDGSPHPFAYRTYAAITYLNTDFKGGEIIFPTYYNFSPKIQPGTLVAFPCTLDYLHGVNKITSGIRYTIAGFFTLNQGHKDAYRI